MSENLDLVRSLYAEWERAPRGLTDRELADWEVGDAGRTDWADPEIQFVFADGPTPGEWTGLAGITDGMRGFLTSWEGWHLIADEYRELDGERVLVLVHYAGRGRESGLDLSLMRTEGANLFHVCGGKVTRLVIYMDRDNALADLGLEG